MCNYDETYLFTDKDIDSYIAKNKTNPNSYMFKACIIELIIDGKTTFEEQNIHSEDFENIKYLIAPINLKNEHWVLYVIKLHYKQSRRSFYMDSLEGGYNKDETNRKCQILTDHITNLLEMYIFYEKDYKLPTLPQTQTNSYDCGPLVCGYAMKIETM